MMTSIGNYIAGEWYPGLGEKFSSVNPSNDQPFWDGYFANKNQADRAVQAAQNAFYSWSSLTLDDRAFYLKQFIEVLKKNKSELAERIGLEIGKPLWEAITEVNAMIGKLEPTLESSRDRNSEKVREIPGGVSKTRFRPHGVIAVIGPYNFPGHMPNGHILPALLAGNTVVFKPSEKAPAVAELIMKYWSEVGLPLGVINLIQGDSNIGNYLCRNQLVRGILFTGSRKVGELIHRLFSLEKICALEMGGNSPLIIWDSTNIDASVYTTIQSSFITTGQRCSSARRLIIPKNEFGEKFLNRLIEITSKISIGRYNDEPAPFMGPLRDSSFVDNLMEFQDQLISAGGVPLLKSQRLNMGKSFVSPGIIDVSPIKQRPDEEVIGPFVQVIRVNSFESAINESNNTQYGLAAGIITESNEIYNNFFNNAQAGIINLNQQLTGASAWAPFGGIKDSGNYRPSGYMAADYCVYSTGSIELSKLTLPNELAPGISI